LRFGERVRRRDAREGIFDGLLGRLLRDEARLGMKLVAQSEPSETVVVGRLPEPELRIVTLLRYGEAL